MAKTRELSICPNCGSTDYLQDYPAPGIAVCMECGKAIIKLELVTIDSKNPIRCPSCNSADLVCIRDEDNEDFEVFNCKCGKTSGYVRAYHDCGYTSGDDVSNDNWSPQEVKVAQQEGKPVLSVTRQKELLKKMEKEQKSPLKKCKQLLLEIQKKKKQLLMNAGIDEQTINFASREANNYLEEKGALTEKQTLILFAATIPFSEGIRLKRREISKCYATERVIEEIFEIDRKTIRVWKQELEKWRLPPTWSIFTYHSNGSRGYEVAELPNDLQSVTRLKQPIFLRDDYRTEVLCWRINFTNGSWSDITDFDYQDFKRSYWESGGKLELP